MIVLWIVPLGATAIGLVGASGAFAAAWWYDVHFPPRDAFFLALATGTGTTVLVFFLGYMSQLEGQGMRFSFASGFTDYVHAELNRSWPRGRSDRFGWDIPVQGYWRLLVQWLGAVAGGFGFMQIVEEMPACDGCRTYLRTRKQHATKDLDSEEIARLREMFRTGDRATVHGIADVAVPARRSTWHGSHLVFRQLVCPTCANVTYEARELWRLSKYGDGGKSRILRTFPPGENGTPPPPSPWR